MKIEKVSYQKTYSIGPYLTDRIGIEASLDERELVSDILDNLRARADEWHKAEHPHLYQETKEFTPIYEGGSITKPNTAAPLEINLQHERIEIAIERASTIDEMKDVKTVYPLMPATLINAYNKKMEELTNG